jgi:hypothetical protein
MSNTKGTVATLSYGDTFRLKVKGTVVILRCGDTFRIKVVDRLEKFWMEGFGNPITDLDLQYTIRKEFSSDYVESKDYYTSLFVAEMLLKSSDADRVVDMEFEGDFGDDD